MTTTDKSTSELFYLVKGICVEDGIKTRTAGDHHLFLGRYREGYDPHQALIPQLMLSHVDFGRPEDFVLEYFGAWERLPNEHVEIRSPRTGLFIQKKGEEDYFVRSIFDGHIASMEAEMCRPLPDIEADGTAEKLYHKVMRLERRWWELFKLKVGWPDLQA